MPLILRNSSEKTHSKNIADYLVSIFSTISHNRSNLSKSTIHPIQTPYTLSTTFSHDHNTNADDSYGVDWTPQDSAYGATCPCGGWIPRKIRRILETTVLILASLILFYAIIKASITLTNEIKGSGENDVDSSAYNYYHIYYDNKSHIYYGGKNAIDIYNNDINYVK